MGKSSQKKGRNGEIELAHILQQYGFDVQPAEAQNYGTLPDLIGLPMIHIEAKRCETLRLSEWMRQASHDAEKFHDGMPAIFHRKNRQDWLCTMRLSDWVQIYKRAMTCKCGGGCCQHKRE